MKFEERVFVNRAPQLFSPLLELSDKIWCGLVKALSQKCAMRKFVLNYYSLLCASSKHRGNTYWDISFILSSFFTITPEVSIRKVNWNKFVLWLVFCILEEKITRVFTVSDYYNDSQLCYLFIVKRGEYPPICVRRWSCSS